MPMAFLDSLMSLLGKQHCTIYYVFGLATLFFAVLSVINGIYQLLDKKSRKSALFLFLNSLTLFFMRIIYTELFTLFASKLCKLFNI